MRSYKVINHDQNHFISEVGGHPCFPEHHLTLAEAWRRFHYYPEFSLNQRKAGNLSGGVIIGWVFSEKKTQLGKRSAGETKS